MLELDHAVVAAVQRDLERYKPGVYTRSIDSSNVGVQRAKAFTFNKSSATRTQQPSRR